VYNAIMAIPGYSYKFEEELGVDKSKGVDSYDYMVTYEAITPSIPVSSAERRPRMAATTGRLSISSHRVTETSMRLIEKEM
jgi:hypothetical protein